MLSKTVFDGVGAMGCGCAGRGLRRKIPRGRATLWSLGAERRLKVDGTKTGFLGEKYFKVTDRQLRLRHSRIVTPKRCLNSFFR